MFRIEIKKWIPAYAGMTVAGMTVAGMIEAVGAWVRRM